MNAFWDGDEMTFGDAMEGVVFLLNGLNTKFEYRNKS